MQDLSGHSGGVGHAGAADGLHQSLLDDAVFDVQGQLAGTLLRGAPAHAVGQAADVGDLLGLDPLALLGNGRGAVVGALGDRTHVLYFAGVDHSLTNPFSRPAASFACSPGDGLWLEPAPQGGSTLCGAGTIRVVQPIRLSPVISTGFSRPIRSSIVGAISARRPPPSALRRRPTTQKGTGLVVWAVKGLLPSSVAASARRCRGRR